MAYLGLFSLFPFLLFLRSLVRHLPIKTQVVERILDGLGALVTQDSRLYEIVRDNIVEQLDAGSPTLLSVSVILMLWGASSAFSALINAINRAYGVKETRSWKRRRGMGILMTLVVAVLIPAGVFLVLLGPRIGDYLAEVTGSDLVQLLWTLGRWPMVFILLVPPMTAIYLVAPNISQKWRWALPGALFAVAAIILSSLGFSWFIGLNMFELKWFTYGAIGTVIVILFWMYLVAFCVLVGAELNAAVGRALDHHPYRQTDAAPRPGGGECPSDPATARGEEPEGGGEADEDPPGKTVGP
jgi:membrane protein